MAVPESHSTQWFASKVEGDFGEYMRRYLLDEFQIHLFNSTEQRAGGGGYANLDENLEKGFFLELRIWQEWIPEYTFDPNKPPDLPRAGVFRNCPFTPPVPEEMKLSRNGTGRCKGGCMEWQCCRGHSISGYEDCVQVEIYPEGHQNAGDINPESIRWDEDGLRSHYRNVRQPRERRIYVHCSVCYKLGKGNHDGRIHYKKLRLRRIVRRVNGRPKVCVHRQCRQYDGGQIEEEEAAEILADPNNLSSKSRRELVAIIEDQKRRIAELEEELN